MRKSLMKWGLVVPSEPDREVGVVDARTAFDLECGLLQPVVRTDQKWSTNRAVASDGAHRSRSNASPVAARPTTPRIGADRVAFFQAPTSPGYETRGQSRRLKLRVSPRTPPIHRSWQASAISSSPSTTAPKTFPGTQPWSPLISKLFRP